jgi:hypothetical protein
VTSGISGGVFVGASVKVLYKILKIMEDLAYIFLMAEEENTQSASVSTVAFPSGIWERAQASVKQTVSACTTIARDRVSTDAEEFDPANCVYPTLYI